MLQVSDLSKRYGDNLLFEKVNFVINARDRVGLVGPNGCGKTTLVRTLLGEEEPDTGSVHHTTRFTTGYLPQALEYEAGANVRDVLSDALGIDEDRLAEQVQELAHQMVDAKGEPLRAIERRYALALDRLTGAASRLPTYVVDQVLAGLGLAEVQPTTPVHILSGGQKTRLGLAAILLSNPSFLLLDEPTNHLDMTALEWLEQYLHQYAGAMLIVSHDRMFLDRIVNWILEIDPLTRQAKMYPGSYSDYVAAKERERQKHWQVFKAQEGRIAQLQSAVRELKGQARGIEKETINFHYRKKAKKVARQAVVRQKRIERMIESEDHVEKPQVTWDMNLEFTDTPPSGQDVLVLEDLGKRFGDNVLFEGVNLILKRGERVTLVGPNGSGKTTLLRMITGREPPTEGMLQLGANVHVGYFSQEQESLDWDVTPLQTVQKIAGLGETEARTFLHLMLFAGDDVFVPVGDLSYGERARLALGVLVLQGCNLLLLDEPINHLDIPSRENFERALSAFRGTVLAVVHDRYFIQHFAAALWSIENYGIHRYIDLDDLKRGQAELNHIE
jgi:ATP-binding cassette subfamily F protein 3